MASHFGGTRQGLAISWPGHITDPGGIRPQFHHVIDVVPTILEATGIHAPEMVNGIKQKPIEGVSMAYTFDKANADKPSDHRTQYFELVANRAIYHDGWVAATTPLTPPWVLTAPAVADPATAFKWELYDLRHDWTENHDLAATNPAKLKELQDLFMAEARKYQVLPLDAAKVTRFVAPRPDVTAGRSEFTYTVPMTGVPLGDAPNLLNTSYTITADIEVPAGGAEGVLLTEGGRFGGWGFYLLKGKPVFTWNVLGLVRPHWEGPEVLAPGKHTLVFDFKYDGLGAATLAYNNVSGIGRGGTGVLTVDGKEAATQKMARTIPLLLQWDETFDIGSDTGTSVDDRDYHTPFAFTGKIVKLNIKVDRPQLSQADIQLLQMEGQRNNRKSE
jgi:arylsulfatase